MQQQQFQCEYTGPIGSIFIVADRQLVHSISFDKSLLNLPEDSESAIMKTVKMQLDRYFEDGDFKFDLPMAPAGTPFQEKIRRLLHEISAGQTVTYQELAVRLGQPHAARAAGNALAQNPLLIVVPCHRVIGKSGQLTGYAGGIDRKKWLLEHESRGFLFRR